MRVCVVIPVYNEAAIIERSIRTILEYVRALPCEAVLVAVNDGSRDQTPEILAALSAQYPNGEFHVISYAPNRGYGGALRVGAAYAIAHHFDYAVFMDCDLTDHPRYLTMMYEKMREGWEYIKTTRHVAAGGYRDVPWKRRVISAVGCTAARTLSGLPLTDLANGFRAVKVGVLRQLHCTQNDFSIIMEELMQAKRVTKKFCEIPRIQGARSADARPSAFTYDPKTLWNYFKYLVIHS